jgi:4-amino-4-deoxychorismate lyase
VPAPAARVQILGEGAAETIPVDDRGFAYGDGVFRTVRVDAGRPWRWAEQMQVLATDCARLAIDLDASGLAAIAQASRSLVRLDSGALRIVVTRGSGPRGYRPPEQGAPRIVLSFSPMRLPAFSAESVAVRLCRTALPLSPATAGIKHLGRLEQVLARAEWRASTWYEGLMRDPDGAVICGTQTNLFLRRGDRLLTPDLSRAGVAGVVRRRLLGDASLLQEAGIRGVDLVSVDAAQLDAADECFLTNALVGVRSVHRIDDERDRTIATFTTTTAANRLRARFAAELEREAFVVAPLDAAREDPGGPTCASR